MIDAYDAMRADRPYRRSMSQADAVAEIQRCSGKQFDPRVVETFVRCQPEIERIRSMDMTEGYANTHDAIKKTEGAATAAAAPAP